MLSYINLGKSLRLCRNNKKQTPLLIGNVCCAGQFDKAEQQWQASGLEATDATRSIQTLLHLKRGDIDAAVALWQAMGEHDIAGDLIVALIMIALRTL
jgi:carbonic anhydrase